MAKKRKSKLVVNDLEQEGVHRGEESPIETEGDDVKGGFTSTLTQAQKAFHDTSLAIIKKIGG